MRASTFVLMMGIARANAFNGAPGPVCGHLPKTLVKDEHRREFLRLLLATIAVKPLQVNAAVSQQDIRQSIDGVRDPRLRDYHSSFLPKWQGTSLPGPLSLAEAYSHICDLSSEPVFNMGKWPDPILRCSSSPIPSSAFQRKNTLEQLQLVASALRNTARKEGAVGLAAQQCGVDASLIFIDGVTSSEFGTEKIGRKGSDTSGDSTMIGAFGQSSWRYSRKEISGEGIDDDELSLAKNWVRMSNKNTEKGKGIFLVNPRIIHRSPESEMLVWTEQCLVLPPEFRATLLRDSEVTIEYEALEFQEDSSGSCGPTKQITFRGELARCAQHEMDHDRGTLIVDHVGLDELLSIGGDMIMAEIENADGLHEKRMRHAFSREVSDSTLLPADDKTVPLAMGTKLEYCTKVKQIDNQYSYEDRHRPWFVQSANAIENWTNSPKPTISPGMPNNMRGDHSSSKANSNLSDCDENCIEERKRIVEKRRAIMQQSRSNTKRADLLELSQQRASLYGTEFRGLPPQYCAQPGFCP